MSCIQCGSCCIRFPCLLGDSSEVTNISEYLGYDIRKHLVVESVEGQYRVRISTVGAPCVLWDRDKGCTVHPVKPKGGREFECWTPSTFKLTYFWNKHELEKIGFSEGVTMGHDQ